MANETKRKRSSNSQKAENNTRKTKRSSSQSSSKKRGSSSRSSSKKVTANSKTSKSRRSSSKANKNRKSNRGQQDQGINMRIELQLVFSFCLMLLLMLSNFGLCGEVGTFMSNFFFGLFGCVQYVLPVFTFIGIALLLINDYSALALKKCFAGFVFFTMISGFVQLFTQTNDCKVYEIFAISLQNRLSAGVIGGGVACMLRQWFGLPGACVIMFCIWILSVIMLTQRSLVGFFIKSVEGYKVRMADRRASRAEKKEKAALKRKSTEDWERERQCEDVVKVLEVQKEEAQKESSRRAVRSRRYQKETGKENDKEEVTRPTFQPSDEVKRKDSVKELHPEPYPFTYEDGKTSSFEKNLDYSAFSLNSGKSSEEYEKERQEQIEFGKDLVRKVDLASQSMASKGAIEIGSKDNSSQEEIVIDAIYEEDLSGESSEELSEESNSSDNEIILEDALPGEATSSPRRRSLSGRERRKRSRTVEKEKEFSLDADEDMLILDDDLVIHKEEEKKNTPLKDTIEKTIRRVTAEGEDYKFPPITMLTAGENNKNVNYDNMLKSTAAKLEETLHSFGVNVKVTEISFGPTVTRYEMVPEQGTKVSKIVSLSDDIRLNLAAADIRIEAPIPGKSAIGIEVPNKDTMTVHFRDLIDSNQFRKFKSKLAFAVGKDIGGQVVITDIAKMPHLLIAGATGSGKSVCINTLIMSILYKARPDEVKMIMIDPKMVELSIYNGIPHLLNPVVTDPRKASGALAWAVAEMTDRYTKFTEVNVRNIQGYNDKLKQLVKVGEIEEDKARNMKMPQIVIIIDELADLMMVAPGEVEDNIVRLSQLARAAGIHLVIATQRPSVNVITGLIKANVPSRIAFAVSSGVDSRTIIDMNGAEKLLGRGDMLFYPSGTSKPSRVQGAFISDEDIAEVVEFLKENQEMLTCEEKKETISFESFAKAAPGKSGGSDRDELFEDAARFLLDKEKASIGMMQRMFKIGFNRAARIMDQLADAGIVGPEEGTKPRKILMSPEQLEQYFEEYL